MFVNVGNSAPEIATVPVAVATNDANDPARMAKFWAPVLGYVSEPPPDGFSSWLAWYQSVVPEEELDGDPDD